MAELSDLFDSLYSHFLLRDIVAKVIPGLLGLSAVLSMLAPFRFLRILRVAQISSLVLIILLYGLGLMFGMLIQYLVSRIPFVKIHVWDGEDDKSSEEVSIKKAAHFLVHAEKYPSLLRKRERLTIIKEMAANYAGALFLMLLAFLYNSLSTRFSWQSTHTLIVIVLVAMIIGLLFQNRSLSTEQRLWEMHALPKEKESVEKTEATSA